VKKVSSWWSDRHSKYPFLILLFTSVLSLAAMVFPIAIRPATYTLNEGEVVFQDIQAPRTLTYESEFYTEQARIEAEGKVSAVYLPADPLITRSQIDRLQRTLDYIGIIRNDSYADRSQKMDDLSKIEGVGLDVIQSQLILDMSDAKWETTKQECLRVLELSMRNSIRPNNVFDIQRNVPTLVSYSLPADQSAIVTKMVPPFITANSLYSDEDTRAAKNIARNAVAPVMVKYVTGQAIVSRGQVITPAILEALEQYKLIRGKNDTQSIIASIALVFALALFVCLYYKKIRPPSLTSNRTIMVIAGSFLVFLIAARFLTPNRTIFPYLFPIAAFGFTLSSLFSLELGILFTFILSVLSAYGLTFGLEITLYYILSSFIGMLVLGRGRHIGSFFWAGVASSGVGMAVILAFRLPNTITDMVGIVTLLGASIFNGMASASTTLLLQFLFAQILGLTTGLQLLDISRPDHPLLQLILQKAPGTYQHSLQVSNLAEQAARVVGADALLVRVGAFHHDAGKVTNPSFFIENQVVGSLNPHNDLDPRECSRTIIQHVADGVMLAQKYGLPSRIQDFIREHHGTLVTRYQFTHALQLAAENQEQVNIDDFRYPGPKPRSRETAILMLADGCEARARAELPSNEKAIEELVRSNIDQVFRDGQLENTDLTMRDLNLIAESFITTLKNTYHPRILYPRYDPHETDASQKTEPLASRKTNRDNDLNKIPQQQERKRK
jgi:putative nucleotidyltransferase with HDIG domain